MGDNEKGNKQSFRCGHCGRNFDITSVIDGRNWCSKCKKYVCNECVHDTKICPSCGTKVMKQTHRQTYIELEFLFGFVFLIVFVVSYFQTTSTILILFCLTSATLLITHGIMEKHLDGIRWKIHEEYVSIMRHGVPHIEDRPGFKDEKIQKMWSRSVIANSFRKGFIAQHSFPEELFDGLQGEWNYPVISKNQRIEILHNSRKSGIKIGSVLLVLGLLLFFGDILIGKTICLSMCGLVLLAIGLYGFYLLTQNRKQVEADSPMECFVKWKHIGSRSTDEAIIDFLKIMDEPYEIEVEVPTQKILNENPIHRFILEDGIAISSIYLGAEFSDFNGGISIRYQTDQYLHAREIQQGLDGFLAGQDLIERVR